jgi:hypothetical protein
VWKKGSAMESSLNWGAIQSGKKPAADGTCPPGSAAQVDSSPTKNGQVAYTTCFKTYPSHLEAARDLIKVVYRGHVTPEVLDSGDLDALAWAMRQNSYFEGQCTAKGPSVLPPCSVFSREMAAAQYANALQESAMAYAKRTGEALAVGRSGSLGVVPTTAADGSPVYATRPVIIGGGAAGAAGALLLLVVAGVGLAHWKGWVLWTDWEPVVVSRARRCGGAV